MVTWATDDVAPEDQAAAPQALTSLAAVALGRAARSLDAREALQVAALNQAREFIRRNASDPGLGPTAIAAALGISLRRLHRMFEAKGDTVSRHILHCRLEAARFRLSSPAFRQVTILDLALSCGFTSLPTFYRTFRDSYGLPPAEYRRIALQSPS